MSHPKWSQIIAQALRVRSACGWPKDKDPKDAVCDVIARTFWREWRSCVSRGRKSVERSAWIAEVARAHRRLEAVRE